MEIELLNQDIQNYLKKYTRFMSKKVYITKRMYDNFVKSYEYIYDSANESIINYNTDKYYNKLLEIKNKGMYALKLHNKKYLDDLYDKYGNIFSDKLSKKEKLTILCEEDIVIMEAKNLDNKIDIVKEKVYYLRDICGVSKNNIGIIVNDEMREKLIDIDAEIFNFMEFGNLLCNDDRKIISDEERYHILSSYIKDILYVDKKQFKKFYEVFKDKLYLDADSLDFETFRDYHSYMFKRKLKDSNKGINEFVKELIVDRRKDLKSIFGEVYDNGILVDIANTLFCSGVSYKYYKEGKYFLIYNDDISYKVVFVNKECDTNNNSDNIIYLYSKYKDGTNACEHLIYELVKRRYPIEKKRYEELYDILKLGMIDSYFSRFIYEMIIPYIDMINRNGYEYLKLVSILDNLNGSIKKEFEILLEIYKYYFSYLEEHDLIDRTKFVNIVNNNINNVCYKYLIVIDDDFDKLIKDNVKFKLFVIKDKRMFPYSYLMSNVKLFCDFKEYLNYQKIIPIIDIYYGDNEIEKIALEFTSKNMDRVCNVYGDTITKKKQVEVYIYDDNDVLKSNINCNYLLSHVVSNIDISKKKKIMLMGRDNRDREILTLGDYFRFSNKNTIICNNNSKCLEYCFMNSEDMNVYETGILMHPMDDKYGFKYDCLDEEVIKVLNKDNVKSYDWEKKLFYMAISRIKNKLYVVVPKSKVSKFVSSIANHNEVMIKREIFSRE